jgi:hypothetical protein
LSEALKAAELAADARVAFQVVELLARRFDVSVQDERVKALRNIASRAKSEAELDSLLAAARGLALDLLAAQRYTEVADLLDSIYECFQAARTDLHAKAISELRKYARRAARAEELMQRAQETLKADPSAAAAHATLGAWSAIYRGDIKEGLKHYQESSDTQWKKLAGAERDQAADPKAVGDLWWEIGLRKDKETKSVMLHRAGHWYQQAMATADSKTKTQLTKRIETIHLLPKFDPSRRSGTLVAAGETVNLLSLVDPQLDALAANWERKYETLQAEPPESDSRIRLPIDVQGSFALNLDFTAVDGQSVLLALPAGGRGFQVVLGVAPAVQLAGIQTIAGNAVPKSGVAVPLRIKPGQRHSLLVRFEQVGEKGRIIVHLDKNPYLAWQGDVTALDDPLEKRGSPAGIAIGSADGKQVLFHAATIQLLSRNGQLLRTADPFRLSK